MGHSCSAMHRAPGAVMINVAMYGVAVTEAADGAQRRSIYCLVMCIDYIYALKIIFKFIIKKII